MTNNSSAKISIRRPGGPGITTRVKTDSGFVCPRSGCRIASSGILG
ncbi:MULTISPECIES: hypothetical protein [unclassified Spirillospora]